MASSAGEAFHGAKSDPVSVISRVSFDPVSLPSREPDATSFLPSELNLDDTAAVLSLFILESCNRKLRQYHLSSLDEEVVNLNIGQGLDYSVDITRTADGELVAVKHRKIEADDQSDAVGRSKKAESARIWKALEELRIVDHPPIARCENIISVKGFGWSYVGGKTTTPSLVVEFAEHGNLRQYLRSRPATSELERWDLLSGVRNGLLVLHSCGIVHGDVKMENVLIFSRSDGTFISKIADFGSSIITVSGKQHHPYWGTDIYNPPEIRLLGSGSNSIPTQQLSYCDVWAFGLLSLEVALNGQCYLDDEGSKYVNHPHMEGFEEYCFRRLDQAGLQNPANVSNHHALMNAALRRDPKDRGSFDDMGTHFSEQPRQESEDDLLFRTQYDAESSVIDLADSITMRSILKGRGTSTFAPEKIPWSVQVEIAERYKQLSQLENNHIWSGFAHLNLGICYYLGFGVERDAEKVGEHMHFSAFLGTPEARLIIYPLAELLGFNLRLEELRAIKGIESEEELAIILGARSHESYRTPFTDLISTRGRNLANLGLKPKDLQLSVALGDFEATKSLLRSGAEDHPNDSGQTALLLACQNGNYKIAQLLVEHGSDPSLADSNGYTPLHMLCMFPDKDIVPLCQCFRATTLDLDIEAFSSTPYLLPDFWDALVGTPLQWATAAGNLTAVRSLLELGAIPTNAPMWFSPVQLASCLFLAEILEVLLKNCQPYDEATIINHGLFYLNEAHPFRPIMIHGKNLPKAIHDTVSVLSADHGADIATPWGTTALMKIALTNTSLTDVTIVQELLKRCDKSIDGPQFSTIQAGILGCNGAPSKTLPRIALMLIDAGFSTRSTSTDSGSWPGWNAMHWASAGPFSEIVEALHSRDPELLQIPTSSETGDHPLHIAAHASYGYDMVQLLLRLGANPCQLNGDGITALVYCIGDSRLQLDMARFEVLLKANAINDYVVDRFGNNLVHFVAVRAAKLDQEGLPGHELLRYILNRSEMKALVNRKNKNGVTPLHLVCYRPDFTSVRLLVEAHADINCMTAGTNAMSPLGLVLEHARAPEKGLADKDLDHIWHRCAYQAACYLQKCMTGTPQDKKLTSLHIAAYCGYPDEVRRLVEVEGASIEAQSAKGFTPLEMLAGLLMRYHQLQVPIDPNYLERAQNILAYLDRRRQM